MGRKNNNVRRSKSRYPQERGAAGRKPNRPTRRPSLDELVMPDGMCTANPRKPKARFATQEKASLALDQAQRLRESRGSLHVEKRFYLCPDCAGYHLTSRESYDPDAWKKADQ